MGQAGGGRREKGKGGAFPLGCKHSTLLDVHVCVSALSSLTTPSPASAVAPPPHLHTIIVFDAFCAQCGACGATAGGTHGLG